MYLLKVNMFNFPLLRPFPTEGQIFIPFVFKIFITFLLYFPSGYDA